MRDFYVEVEGIEIPILSYEIIDGKKVRLNAYYDYQNDLVNILARKYIAGYSKQNKDSIRKMIKGISDYFNSSIELTNQELIDFYINKYLIHEDDNYYVFVNNKIRNTMIDAIKNQLDYDKFITLDYRNELEQDPEYQFVYKRIRDILRIIRKDILNSDSVVVSKELGEALRIVLGNYSKMKEQIANKIYYSLKNNPNYKKNKNTAYKMIPGIVEADLEDYIDYEKNTISLGDFLNFVPIDYIVRAAKEILENKKLNYYSRLFSVMSAICRKEDGSSYTNTEKESAIVRTYCNLLYSEEDSIEVIFNELEMEKEEPLDSSRDMKGRHSFKPYYNKREQDYYGHDEDSREDVTDSFDNIEYYTISPEDYLDDDCEEEQSMKI